MIGQAHLLLQERRKQMQSYPDEPLCSMDRKHHKASPVDPAFRHLTGSITLSAGSRVSERAFAARRENFTENSRTADCLMIIYDKCTADIRMTCLLGGSYSSHRSILL